MFDNYFEREPFETRISAKDLMSTVRYKYLNPFFMNAPQF